MIGGVDRIFLEIDDIIAVLLRRVLEVRRQRQREEVVAAVDRKLLDLGRGALQLGDQDLETTALLLSVPKRYLNPDRRPARRTAVLMSDLYLSETLLAALVAPEPKGEKRIHLVLGDQLLGELHALGVDD